MQNEGDSLLFMGLVGVWFEGILAIQLVIAGPSGRTV
jgi:hypothetical protein